MGPAVALFVVLFGPVPLAYALSRIGSTARDASTSLACTTFLFVWLAVQHAVATLLGATSRMNLQSVVLLESGLFALGLLVLRRMPRAAASRRSVRAIELLAGIPLLLALALFGSSAVLEPTTDYDSLAYHLPAIADWHRTSKFSVLEQFDYRMNPPGQLGAMISGLIARYPFGAEAIAALFTFPLKGLALATLPNVAAALLAVAGVVALSRELGAAREAALAAAAIAAACPLFREQAATLHVDLLLGALFIAGLLFALVAARRRSLAFLALALCVAAISCAVKTTGVAYAALIGFYFVACAIRCRAARAPEQQVRSIEPVIGSALVALLVANLAAASFWYVRNWIELDNPLGYVRVSIFGSSLFPGPVPAELLSTTSVFRVFRASDRGDWAILANRIWFEIGPAALVLFAAFVQAAGSALRASAQVGFAPRARSLLALVMCGAFTLYVFAPYSGDNTTHAFRITPWIGQAFRYGFGAILLGAVLVACETSRGGHARRGVMVALLVVVALVPLLPWPIALLSIVLPLVACRRRALFARWARRRWNWAPAGSPLRIWGSRACAAILLTLTLVGGARVKSARAAAQNVFFRSAIAEHVPQGSRIGYVQSHKSALFYGDPIAYDVEYVPCSCDDPVSWQKQLENQDIRWIAVGPLEPEWMKSKEVLWLERSGELFEPIAKQDGAHPAALYRVRRTAPRAHSDVRFRTNQE